MPDRWTEFNEMFRTRACARDAHADCPHLIDIGGGIDPRRFLPGFGAVLCGCSCHASCPVTVTTRRMTVPAKTWYASCTCPGAGQARQRMDEAGSGFPDFGEVLQEEQRRARARKDAFEATRAGAAGRNRREVREIYVRELRSRGLRIPADNALDAVVERINGNPLPTARLLGEGLVETGRMLHGLVKIFRQGTRGA